MTTLSSDKGQSINTLILDAIQKYLLDQNRVAPMDPPPGARQFSVRMPDYLKVGILQTAAEYQVKIGKRVSNNMIVNTAIIEYLRANNALG